MFYFTPHTSAYMAITIKCIKIVSVKLLHFIHCCNTFIPDFMIQFWILKYSFFYFRIWNWIIKLGSIRTVYMVQSRMQKVVMNQHCRWVVLNGWCIHVNMYVWASTLPFSENPNEHWNSLSALSNIHEKWVFRYLAYSPTSPINSSHAFFTSTYVV